MSSSHLGVDGQNLSRLGTDQRVDLRQGAIVFVENVDQAAKDFLGSRELLLVLQAQGGGELGALKTRQTQVRVQPALDYGAGVSVGHLFDLHAALARDHDHGAALGAIDDHGGVVLGVDVHGRRDQQLLDRDALRTGLRRNHAVGEHELGGVADLFGGVAELDEAGLAAPAGEDLGLHHDFAADGIVG